MKLTWHVQEDYRFLREMNRLLHVGRAAKPLIKNRLSQVVSGSFQGGGATTPQDGIAPARPASETKRHLGIAMLCVAVAGSALLGSYAVAHGKWFLMMPGRAGSADGAMVSLEALWPTQSIEVLRHLKIQYNGRLSTVDQFARELLTFVTGSDHVDRQDPVHTVFSMLAYPDRWRRVPLVLVDAVPAREVLGLNRGPGRVSLNQLINTQGLPRVMLTVARKQNRGQPLAPFELELVTVAARCAVLEGLLEQHLYLVSPPHGVTPGDAWVPILAPDGYPAEQQVGLKRSWGTFISALREGYPQSIKRATGQLALVLQNLNRPKLHEASLRGVGMPTQLR